MVPEKKRLFGMLYLGSMLFCASYLSGETLANGDFDDDLKGWSVSAGAEIDTKIYKTKEAVGEGEVPKSLRISCARVKGWGNARQNVKVEGGACYATEVWVKLQDANQTHVKVDWYDKNGKSVGVSFVCHGTNGDRDWFKVSTVAEAPAAAATAALTLLGGKGVSWFDAVKFVKSQSPIRHIGQEEWTKAAQAKYGKDMIAPEMTGKTVYYDLRHDGCWVSDVGKLLSFLNNRGFVTKNADELKAWMLDKAQKGADGTVCVMAMGIVPNSITESMTSACTLRKYMDAGGRVVWIGDIPLFYQSFTDKALTEWGGGKRILGTAYGKRNITAKVQITGLGRQWGMETVDSASRTIMAADATLVFSEVPGVPPYACSWFKNYNSEFPYSGFLRYRATVYEAMNAGLNHDLYRLALYRGHPISVPRVEGEDGIGKLEAITIALPFKNYSRGQRIPVTVKIGEGVDGSGISLKLERDTETVMELTAPFAKEAVFNVETQNLAAGEYVLSAQLKQGGKTVARGSEKLFVAATKTAKLPIGMFGVMGGSTEYKARIILDDLREHLGECGFFTGGGALLWDDALRYGLKVMPKSGAYYGSLLPLDQSPELHMRVSTGKWPAYHYGGSTRAPICVGNPVNRQRINTVFKDEIRRVRNYPAFMKRMLVSDDVAMYGDPGEHLLACYCGHCKNEFKELSGFDAPLQPAAEILKKRGVVSDNDPWYLWMKFRTKNVYGGWNSSMEQAKNEIDPEIKFGLGIGGWEVLSPQWTLNPPDTYGGIGMVSFYHYPQLSRPCIYFLSQAALAMMGNRGKEYWGIPQSSDYASVINNPLAHKMLVRNEFYYLLAAGARGMVYFHYPPMPGTAAWEEFKNLSRIGTEFGPLLLSLNKAPADVAVLASYCNASYQWADGGKHANACESLYISLLKAHVPADMVCDEEALAGGLGKYKVLLLADVDYLTQSLHERIVQFIAAGGVVVADPACGLKFPGVETREGEAMAAFAKAKAGAPFEVDTPALTVSEFAGGDAGYLMLVNGDTHKPVTGKVVLRGMGDRALYNVFSGERLNGKGLLGRVMGLFSKGGGDAEFEVTVDAAGGCLIGVYPSEIEGVSVGVPDKVSRGKTVPVNIEIAGRDGKAMKANFPVKVTFRNPRGEAPEYSDYHVAVDGKLIVHFTPASNDIPGEWTVDVAELASGTENKQHFQLE